MCIIYTPPGLCISVLQPDLRPSVHNHHKLTHSPVTLLLPSAPGGGGGSHLIFVCGCTTAASEPLHFLLQNLRKRHPFSYKICPAC